MKKLNTKSLVALANAIAHLPSSSTNVDAPELAGMLGVERVEYWKMNGLVSLVVYPTDDTFVEYWAPELIRDVAYDWMWSLESVIQSSTRQTWDWVRSDVLSNLLGFDGDELDQGVFYVNATGSMPWLKIMDGSANTVFEYTMSSFLREFG